MSVKKHHQQQLLATKDATLSSAMRSAASATSLPLLLRVNNSPIVMQKLMEETDSFSTSMLSDVSDAWNVIKDEYEKTYSFSEFQRLWQTRNTLHTLSNLDRQQENDSLRMFSENNGFSRATFTLRPTDEQLRYIVADHIAEISMAIFTGALLPPHNGTIVFSTSFIESTPAVARAFKTIESSCSKVFDIREHPEFKAEHFSQERKILQYHGDIPQADLLYWALCKYSSFRALIPSIILQTRLGASTYLSEHATETSYVALPVMRTVFRSMGNEHAAGIHLPDLYFAYRARIRPCAPPDDYLVRYIDLSQCPGADRAITFAKRFDAALRCWNAVLACGIKEEWKTPAIDRSAQGQEDFAEYLEWLGEKVGITNMISALDYGLSVKDVLAGMSDEILGSK